MREKELLEKVLEEIDKAMLVAQPPQWGEKVSKWECFNDGIKEARWAVERMIDR